MIGFPYWSFKVIVTVDLTAPALTCTSVEGEAEIVEVLVWATNKEFNVIELSTPMAELGPVVLTITSWAALLDKGVHANPVASVVVKVVEPKVTDVPKPSIVIDVPDWQAVSLASLSDARTKRELPTLAEEVSPVGEAHVPPV